MSDDIVTRLRKQEVGKYNALLWDEAADEIERLRAELVRKADELAATIRELRKVEAERDEARREICEMLERDAGFAAQRQANSRGWDCFKEEK